MPIKPLNRRTFIKGMGVTLSLPFLEAMLPFNRSWAASPSRFSALFMGNGMLTGRTGLGGANDFWSCQGNANGITGFSVPMQKLAAYKDYLTVVQNCSFRHFTENEGAAAHEMAAAGFLCGQIVATAKNIRPPQAGPTEVDRLASSGMSIDRMISAKRDTRLRNLMLGVGPMNARFTIYDVTKQVMGTLSWDSQVAHLQNEMLYTASDAFKRLTSSGLNGSAPNTGGTDPNLLYSQKKSILDGVLGDVNSMMSRLGNADKQVMNQYLDSLRKIEKDLQNSQVPVTPIASCTAPSAAKEASYKSDANLNYNQVTQTTQNMCELMTLAFQCGITDVATLMLSYDGSMIPGGQLNSAYQVSNYSGDNYHGATHYVGNVDPNALEITKSVNTWHASQLAYFAQLLKGTMDSDGRSILDNSVVLFGAGMGDPDTHSFDNMFRAILGKGAGLNPGANGKVINAGGGDAHPKLLQSIVGGFGIQDTVGMSGGQKIAGIFG